MYPNHSFSKSQSININLFTLIPSFYRHVYEISTSLFLRSFIFVMFVILSLTFRSTLFILDGCKYSYLHLLNFRRRPTVSESKFCFVSVHEVSGLSLLCFLNVYFYLFLVCFYFVYIKIQFFSFSVLFHHHRDNYNQFYFEVSFYETYLLTKYFQRQVLLTHYMILYRVFMFSFSINFCFFTLFYINNTF